MAEVVSSRRTFTSENMSTAIAAFRFVVLAAVAVLGGSLYLTCRLIRRLAREDQA